jgi:hypothetical protein
MDVSAVGGQTSQLVSTDERRAIIDSTKLGVFPIRGDCYGQRTGCDIAADHRREKSTWFELLTEEGQHSLVDISQSVPTSR